MRIARAIGDVSVLLPEGIDHLGDCPWPLHQAIVHGLRFLGYEEFPMDERPPKRIWMDGAKLDEHWERIDAEREARIKGEDKPKDDDEPAWENGVELLTRG